MFQLKMSKHCSIQKIKKIYTPPALQAAKYGQRHGVRKAVEYGVDQSKTSVMFVHLECLAKKFFYILIRWERAIDSMYSFFFSCCPPSHYFLL